MATPIAIGTLQESPSRNQIGPISFGIQKDIKSCLANGETDME